MAFAITQFRGLQGSTAMIGLPNQKAANLASGGPTEFMGSQADLAIPGAGTVNSTIFDAGSAVLSSKSLVWIKASTITGNLEVRLQASSSATFASDVVDIDSKVEIVAVTANLKSFTLYGSLSDSARQFYRVSIVSTSAGTATVDLIVTAF